LTTIWTPPENKDHRVTIEDGTGKFLKVIQGRKTLRKILEEHRDSKSREDPTKDRLTASQKTKFNTINNL